MNESGDTSLSFTESKVNTSPRPDSDKSNGENIECEASGGGAVSEGAVGGADGVSGPGTVLCSSHRPVYIDCNERDFGLNYLFMI